MSSKAALSFLITALFIFFGFAQFFFDILNTPFFWDELGVYSRAAIHQAVHGISLLPGSTPDVLSRGHPLLSSAYFGAGFKLFGISLTVARLCAFVIYGATCIISFYWIKEKISPIKALLITIVLALQPVFFSQAFLVLPEQMLMCLTLLSIYFFDSDRDFALVVSLAVAVLVKESALVLPIAFGFAYFLKKSSLLKTTYISFLPLATFAIFLVLQKIKLSYYLYPLHTSLINLKPSVVFDKFTEVIWFTFIAQGRFAISITLLIILALKWRKIKARDLLNSSVFWIVLGGIGFTIINYYLGRYTQYWLWPFLAFSLYFVYRNINLKLSIALTAAFILCSLLFMNSKQNFTDTNFSYVSHTKALEKTITQLNKIAKGKKVAYTWPYVMHTWSIHSGYPKASHEVIEFNPDSVINYNFIVTGNLGQPKVKEVEIKLDSIWKKEKLNLGEVDFNQVYLFRK